MKKIKNKNKDKRGDIAIDKLILIILGILVVLAIVFFYANPYLNNWIKNLPRYKYNDTDRVISEFTPDQLTGMGCVNIVARLSFENNKKFFYMSGRRTDLYIDGEAIRLLNKGELIGSVRNNEVSILPAYLDRYSQTYQELINLGLPSAEELGLIHNSFILEASDYVCKSDKRIDTIKEKQRCVATCSLYNGVCSSNAVSGKIANGKLNCKENELCYVSESETQLSNGNLKLNHFYMYDLTKSSYQDKEDLINKDSIELYTGKKISFSMDAFSDTSYCFFLDSNLRFIYGSYVESGSIPNRNPLIITDDYYHELAYSGEKIFEFVAWSPNDESKKVLKRVKIIAAKQFPEGYEPGEIVLDSQLKQTSLKTLEGGFFYIFNVNKDWIWRSGIFGAGAMTTSNYRITRNEKDDVSIFAFDETEKAWHELDCNVGGWFGKSIYIENLEDSLSATFAKGKCKW